MLRALVAAAEAALETKIKVVQTSSGGLGQAHFIEINNVVEADLKDLGMEIDENMWKTGVYLLLALNITMPECGGWLTPDHLDWVEVPDANIVILEHTRQALTAIRWVTECDIAGSIAEFQNRALGARAIESCKDQATSPEQCAKPLTTALQGLAAIDGFDSTEHPIQEVLVFGEQGYDKTLTTSLRQFLDDSFPNGQSIEIGRLKTFSPDLSFAGPRAVASYMLQLQKWEFESQAYRKRNEL